QQSGVAFREPALGQGSGKRQRCIGRGIFEYLAKRPLAKHRNAACARLVQSRHEYASVDERRRQCPDHQYVASAREIARDKAAALDDLPLKLFAAALREPAIERDGAPEQVHELTRCGTFSWAPAWPWTRRLLPGPLQPPEPLQLRGHPC